MNEKYCNLNIVDKNHLLLTTVTIQWRSCPITNRNAIKEKKKTEKWMIKDLLLNDNTYWIFSYSLFLFSSHLPMQIGFNKRQKCWFFSLSFCFCSFSHISRLFHVNALYFYFEFSNDQTAPQYLSALCLL